MTNQEASKVIKDGLEDMSLDFADEEQYEALTMAIKALEQEPSGDLISRQELLEDLYKRDYTKFTHRDFVALVQYQDTVQQVPKTGHWVEKDGFDGDVYYDCSECGESWTTIEGTPWQNGMAYCPNCGAKMIEPQESED